MSELRLAVVEREVRFVVESEPAPVTVKVGGQAPAWGDILGKPGSFKADVREFVQASPSLEWTVNHNTGRRPIVQLQTVGGVDMVGDVAHVSQNQFVVRFSQPTAGIARYA